MNETNLNSGQIERGIFVDNTLENKPTKHISIGILAHVDAGKTTLAEQLLYKTGTIHTLGRVDEKNTVLDNEEAEKRRGITIFLGQASFSYKDAFYYLLDTPGHVDFSAEMERSLDVIDIAILVINLSAGVQGHTMTVWKKLRELKIPTIFFLNKIDLPNAQLKKVIEQIKEKLTNKIFLLPEIEKQENYLKDLNWKQLLEETAEENDALLELYLSEENAHSFLDYDKIRNAIWNQVTENELFPCIIGSGLKQKGIEELLESISAIREKLEEKEEQKNAEQGFAGFVYKIRRDEKGMRVVYIKVLTGMLSVKEEIEFHLPSGENGRQKIEQIRLYRGTKYQVVQSVKKGDICGIVGLEGAVIGTGLGNCKPKQNYSINPILRVRVMPKEAGQKRRLLETLKILEEEDPMLKTGYEPHLEQIFVHIMGEVQLEILEEILRERFELEVTFGTCEVQYLETIKESVMGYGHFEPLRHYAEVHIKISPGERGSGVKVINECMNDVLKPNYQSLIQQHILEKQHKGVLLGAPLTDVVITLITGRAHIKHTEGGDFREATYRAIRQGLEKAESIILEPIYHFSIAVEEKLAGHVMADIKRIYGETEEILNMSGEVQITGRCPAVTMMEYAKELLVFSKGKGVLQVTLDGYEVCHNSEEVIQKIGYDRKRDVQNPSSSVFCSHGSGFIVSWEDAEKYMHCPVQKE